MLPRTKIGIPSLFEMDEIFKNEKSAIIYLIQKEVLCFQINCPHCSVLNVWNLKTKSIRCTNPHCHKSYSALKDTFFENSKIKINLILTLAYYWLLRMPVTSITVMLNISSKTACDYYSFFEKLVADEISETIQKIGGQNVIVEIDESKFGRRKYNKGHWVEGTWIVGGVERTPERRMFAVAVNDRSTDTIEAIINQCVEPGSIIYTDFWKSYDTAINEINFINDSTVFEHKKVNHSDEFITEDCVHTNTIEGTWNGIKCTMNTRQKSKDKCPIHILTFIWRRQSKGRLWDAFLDALKHLHLE